ncbi:hypothetical protein BD626DRAFT_507336 [Schizophyllum amplum]|uniref:Uncharacterized protein n=1 Tax=Schizophyllum amplum TaxID=97359 RepID=A0A550C3Z5_9AGAR|nr:hypothetical protein BD626DRAFT_507336 [Auriculariopsis ampla]
MAGDRQAAPHHKFLMTRRSRAQMNISRSQLPQHSAACLATPIHIHRSRSPKTLSRIVRSRKVAVLFRP